MSKKRKAGSTESNLSGEPPRKKRKKTKNKSKSKQENEDSSSESQRISKNDFYIKNAAFRLWLFESEKKYFENLSKKKSNKYFKKFCKLYNHHKLPEKFYQDIAPQSLDSIHRTKYHWNFNLTENEQNQMTIHKDTTDSFTNDTSKIQEIKAEIEKKEKKKEERKKRREKYEKNNMERNENDILRKENERSLLKNERKKFRKDREVVEEELVPKKDGFARRVEKRKMKHRQISENDERDFDEWKNDDHLDFSKFKERRERMVQQKHSSETEKYRKFREKEDRLMAQFQKVIDEKK